MLRTFLAVFMLAQLPLAAQVLDTTRSWVVNGDFERIEAKKLKRQGGIDYAAGWSSATAVKADLFSELATVDSKVSAPKNFAGEQMALSGGNYAGIRWWSYMGKEPRAYLQTKLKKPMKKDSLYCVRYYVSLSDLSKYATAELGAYITKQKISKEDEANLTYEPKVPQLRTKIYSDMYSWQGVCGAYQAEGFEQYLVLGNFASNEKTLNEKAKRPKGSTGVQVFSAYYYIDNVEVYPIKNRGECSCEQLDKAESEFIFSRRGVSTASMTPAAKVEQQVFYFKSFQRTLDSSMEPWLSEMVAAMKEDANIKVTLIGHIDAKEVERIRMRPDLASLGKERAEMVRDALVEAGIETARITVSSLDGTAPVDESGTEMGASKNRRVEVELKK